MSSIVIKVGHAVIDKDRGINVEKINQVASVIKRNLLNNKFVLVIGGGLLAREYISAARSLGCEESFSDEIGIAFTRLNCMLFIPALRNFVYPKPVTSLEELRQAIKLYDVVTIGGLSPGQSTDAVAALSAEAVSAEMFIKVLDVGGIYDKDPKIFKDAKLLKEVSYNDLLNIVLKSAGSKAGEYKPIDLLALQILRRSKIKTVFVGDIVRDLELVLHGEKVGTTVKWE